MTIKEATRNINAEDMLVIKVKRDVCLILVDRQ